VRRAAPTRGARGSTSQRRSEGKGEGGTSEADRRGVHQSTRPKEGTGRLRLAEGSRYDGEVPSPTITDD
jgi:hypothetical protein